MKLLFDNNVSPKVARAIGQLLDEGDVSVPLREKFSQSTRDVEWITALGSEGGWAVISGDLRITKTRAKVSVAEYGLGWLLYGAGVGPTFASRTNRSIVTKAPRYRDADQPDIWACPFLASYRE